MLTYSNLKIEMVTTTTTKWDTKKQESIPLKTPKVTRSIIYNDIHAFMDIGELYKFVETFAMQTSAYTSAYGDSCISVSFDTELEY